MEETANVRAYQSCTRQASTLRTGLYGIGDSLLDIDPRYTQIYAKKNLIAYGSC